MATALLGEDSTKEIAGRASDNFVGDMVGKATTTAKTDKGPTHTGPRYSQRFRVYPGLRTGEGFLHAR